MSPLLFDLHQLHEVWTWTKNFKRSPSEEVDVEMTGEGQVSGKSPRLDRIRLRNVLSMSRTISRARHKSEPHRQTTG